MRENMWTYLMVDLEASCSDETKKRVGGFFQWWKGEEKVPGDMDQKEKFYI